MFQVDSDKKDDKNELISVLEQEFEYFETLLQYTEKSLAQVDSLSVSVLTEMLKYRQEWIDKIQLLEQKRKNLVDKYPGVDQEVYLKKISSIAGDLVEVDRQIYKNLEYRKMKYIQQISYNAMGKNFMTRNQSKSQILDITQE